MCSPKYIQCQHILRKRMNAFLLRKKMYRIVIYNAVGNNDKEVHAAPTLCATNCVALSIQPFGLICNCFNELRFYICTYIVSHGVFSSHVCENDVVSLN